MKSPLKVLLSASLMALYLAVCPLGSSAQAANPFTTALKATVKSSTSKMVAAARLMPEDKFSFKPTPASMSFGQLTLHIATSNDGSCATLGGIAPLPRTTLTPTSPKDQLVKALQDSFAYCTKAIDNFSDADLGKEVAGFGGRKMSAAALALVLTDDWADHYSQQAAYLRLNGILPPTARGRGGMGRGMGRGMGGGMGSGMGSGH
ncbi:MAG TPA: DinB family protein [Terriglobales bacterium]|nr:DinB family protein [Terriglobales bacterium]